MYIKISHKTTGQEIIIDTSGARAKRLCQGFLNKTSQSKRFYKHIILTQVVENYHSRILNQFFSAMRKWYQDIQYIWTMEEQKRGVLHWHVVVAFPYDVQFGRSDILRIQNYWKYGIVEVVPVRRISFQYLLKYISKSLESGIDGVRRIGSSMIEGFYRQSRKWFLRAMEWLSGCGVSWDSFFWSNGDAYLYEDWKYRKGRVYIYRRPRDWELIEVLGYNPF